MRSRSDKQKAERRQDIIGAAIPLFAANGFSATGMSAVAQAAGVSHGTIFLYFENKEALFEAALVEPLLEAEAEFHKVLSGDGSPKERIIRMVNQQVMAFARNETYLRLVHYVIGQRERFPHLAQRCYDYSHRYTAVLRPVIEEAQRLGQIPAGNSGAVTLSYYCFLNGVGLTVMAPPEYPLWPEIILMGLRIFGISDEN